MINAIHFYRIARWLYLHRIPLFPKLFMLFIFLCYNCSIPYKIRIGKGTFFNHGGLGVLLNEVVEIGDNCKIGNNVSIVGQSPYRNAPKIGNNVYIGSGAVVQGPVIIEDGVVIAPNAVVTKSVKADMIVAGIPAKIIGSTKDLNYNIFNNECFDESIKKYL